MWSCVFWRRTTFSFIFMLGLCCTSCALTTTVAPHAALTGGPGTFIEVVRIIESAYWDTDKVNPQTLLKCVVDGMEPDLIRQQGHISYQGDQLVLSLNGQTKAVGLTSVNTPHELMRAFADIHDFVLQHQPPTAERLNWEYRAIEGMVKGLDSNSAFMPPHVFRELQEEMQGSFGGIGIRLGLEEGELVILGPMQGIAGSRAGLKGGDRIVKIDGSPTKGLTLQEAVRRLRGPVGSRVVLGLLRTGSTEPEDVAIIRAKIEIETVESRILDGHIGYVKVHSFHETTDQEAERALNQLAQHKVQGLILDLRDNPGGFLIQAVKVSNLFLDEGLLVVSTEGRLPYQNARYLTNGAGPYRHYPLIVLINSASASSAEIVTGALQDLHRAMIVGTRSYGKGSVQTIVPLDDGAGLRLTTAHYFTPGGRSVDRIGIMPDIEGHNAGKEDRQLSMSQAILQEALALANRRSSPSRREAGRIDNSALLEVGRAMLATPAVPP